VQGCQTARRLRATQSSVDIDGVAEFSKRYSREAFLAAAVIGFYGFSGRGACALATLRAALG
jgi:hypothetical protein